MHRLAVRLLASLLFVAALSACQRPAPIASAASAPVAASAASVAQRGTGVADDDKPESLMRAAFGSVDADHPPTMEVPADDPQQPAMSIDVAPLMVVAPDETHRVLLLGPPPGDNPDGNGGHASPGNLGGIWYTRQGTRWAESGRQPSILWTGFFGNLGTLSKVDLGPQHHAVAIANGSCWQGFCGEWLNVVEFGPGKAVVVLSSLRTGSSSMGASESCPDAPAPAAVASAPSAPAVGELASAAASAPASAAASAPEDAESAGLADKCVDITSTWCMQAREGAERGDLVVKFTGSEPVPAGKSPSPELRAVDETLVLRDAGGVYKPVSGRNPTRAI